jgi:hypothetical protein
MQLPGSQKIKSNLHPTKKAAEISTAFLFSQKLFFIFTFPEIKRSPLSYFFALSFFRLHQESLCANEYV